MVEQKRVVLEALKYQKKKVALSLTISDRGYYMAARRKTFLFECFEISRGITFLLEAL